MEIDAVITWVDGNDPVLNARRSQYAPASALKRQDVAGATRYANLGEIFWCVASLNRFAPFLRRIYIVTDGQDPCLDASVAACFPDGYIPMEIVDHKEIFKGYEEYLPVFNSRAIETMLWRIPGLSEHYLLMNDDFLLVNPVSGSDFFAGDGQPLCYAARFNALWARLLRKLKPKKDGSEAVTFKSSMLNALDILGGGREILYLAHTPRPLLKSFYETFFDGRDELIIRNIGHRFRDASQYNSQELQYLSLNACGGCRVIGKGVRDFYLEPKPKPDYIKKKLALLNSGKFLFCCFNSLDKASEEDRRLVYDWVKERLGLSESQLFSGLR